MNFRHIWLNVYDIFNVIQDFQHCNNNRSLNHEVFSDFYHKDNDSFSLIFYESSYVRVLTISHTVHSVRYCDHCHVVGVVKNELDNNVFLTSYNDDHD